MALDAMQDGTTSNIWNTISPDVVGGRHSKQNINADWNRRVNSQAKSRNGANTANRRRGTNRRHRHSFLYTHFPDHRQLTPLDYARFINETGHDEEGHPASIDYAPISGRSNEYMINPNADPDTHEMTSVNMEVVPYMVYDNNHNLVVDSNAQYHDHPLSKVIFYRNSSGDGGQNGDYGSNDGFDSLTNFMMMYNNNDLDANSPSFVNPELSDPASRKWANKHRMDFDKAYYRHYHTYESGFTVKGIRFNPKTHRVVLSNGSSYQGRDLNVSRDDGDFKDKFYRRRNTFNHNRDYHTAAYTYLGNKRGMSRHLIRQQLNSGQLRSYEGVVKYHIFKNVNKSELEAIKNSKYEGQKGSRYDAKRHIYYSLTGSMEARDPRVEYGWYRPTYEKQGVDSKDADTLLHSVPKDKKRFVKSPHGGYVLQGHPDIHIKFKNVSNKVPAVEKDSNGNTKVKKFPKVRGFYKPGTNKVLSVDATLLSYMDVGSAVDNFESMSVKDPKTGQEVLRGHPDVKAKIDMVPETKSVIKPEYAGMYRYVPTGEHKAVGADRIYLQRDPKSVHTYKHKLDAKYTHGLGSAEVVTKYYRTNNNVDRDMFSRGKQISKHPKPQYGFNFQSGNGRKNLFVFEDPTDAESFYNLNQSYLKHTNSTYLSLGGVSKIKTINNYMRVMHAKPGDFKNVILCPDNDDAGHNMVQKIMASNTNKHDFAKHGSTYVSPVTHSKQRILMDVPGVHFGRDRIPHKWLKGEIGRDHCKDFNDVLQCNRGKNLYKGLKGKPVIRKMWHRPSQGMNIDQYTRMNIYDMLHKMPKLDRIRTRDIFAQYKGVAHDMSANTKRTGHLKQMTKDFQALSSNSQTVLKDYMNNGGGKFISPHDLNYYSHTNGFGRQVHNTEGRAQGRTRYVGRDAQSREQSEHRSKPSVEPMNRFKADSQAQRYYNLMLRVKAYSEKPVLPLSANDMPKSIKGVLLEQRQTRGNLLYKSVSTSFANRNRPAYLRAKSMMSHVNDVASTAKRSDGYLAKNHIKPIKKASDFTAHIDNVGRLKKNMSDINKAYSKEIIKMVHGRKSQHNEHTKAREQSRDNSQQKPTKAQQFVNSIHNAERQGAHSHHEIQAFRKSRRQHANDTRKRSVENQRKAAQSHNNGHTPHTPDWV